MDFENDLLESLTSNETPFASKQDNNTGKKSWSKKPKGPNLWEKNDFEPLKLDPETLNKTGKSFAVAYYKNGKDADDATIEKFVKVARVLASRGYKFRYNGSADDKLQAAILAIENLETDVYLPWKGYNKGIAAPKMGYPNETAYRIASAYHKTFSTLPPTIRAVNANNVNLLFDTDCNNPIDMLLCYSECGSEVVDYKTVDFKKIGYITQHLNLAKIASIPVFNLQKEDAFGRIANMLKAGQNS